MGIIAVAVLVIAIVQVALAIAALRATQQLGQLMAKVEQLTARLEQDIRPIVANLQAITAEAAKATAIAAVQVERADKLFADLATRLEDTIANVQQTVAGATRGGAWLAGIKAAMAALRDLRAPGARRPTHAEEEDALFIG